VDVCRVQRGFHRRAVFHRDVDVHGLFGVHVDVKALDGLCAAEHAVGVGKGAVAKDVVGVLFHHDGMFLILVHHGDAALGVGAGLQRCGGLVCRGQRRRTQAQGHGTGHQRRRQASDEVALFHAAFLL